MVARVLVTLVGFTGPLYGQVSQEEPRSTVPSTVRGVVLEHESGTPLSDAAVTLIPRSERVGSPDSRESDLRGRFLFRDVPPDTYVLLVERPGFRDYRDTLVVVPDSEIRVVVELSPSPLPLEALVVVVSRSPAMTGFEARRRRGRGTFITRDEIEAMNPTRVTELLRTVPGAQFARRRFGGLELRLRGGCRPTVWVNGARAISASSAEIGVDQLLSPFEVEAVEVYRGAGSVPVQFGPETCGAVVVWTRQPSGQEEEGSVWTRLLVAAGIALALVTLH